jgi:hypothetical protein
MVKGVVLEPEGNGGMLGTQLVEFIKGIRTAKL